MAKTTETPADQTAQSADVAATNAGLLALAEPAAPAVEQKFSVKDFCLRKSETLKRTELISAFYADEVRARRLNDTVSAFEERFVTFTNKPA